MPADTHDIVSGGGTGVPYAPATAPERSLDGDRVTENRSGGTRR